MTIFSDDKECLQFLKNFKLATSSAIKIPTLYYYDSNSVIPNICTVVGYEKIYSEWATVVISVDNTYINIHSSYLYEMQKRKRPEVDSSVSVSSSPSYIVFDLETTGTNHKKDEIIEIAAIKIYEDHIDEFSELVSTDVIIPFNVSLLTGITNEMIYDAPTIDEVLPRFLNFIGNNKLVGHNIRSFDLYFLNDACDRCCFPQISNDTIDTLYVSRNLLPDLEKHDLASLCDYYNIDSSNAHRALSDCYICNAVYNELISPKDESLCKLSSCDSFSEPIIKLLNTLENKYELLSGSLLLKKRENITFTSYSIYIHEISYPAGSGLDSDNSIAKIEYNKGIITLFISSGIYDSIQRKLFGNYRTSIIKSSKTTQSRIKIIFSYNQSDFINNISNIVECGLSRYHSSASSFGCCSKFVECSDALKCVHENKLYSTSCKYRYNLENGHVFYGKNKNVE